MNKRTILILTIVVDLLISGVVIFGLQANQRLDRQISESPSLSELRENHQQKLRTDNPVFLREHANRLWNLFEDTEKARVSRSEAYESGMKAVLVIVGFHFIATLVGLSKFNNRTP